MLDLGDIPVVDNHCHSMLVQQRMDSLQFRRCFSEAKDPSFAQQHLPSTVYYLWLLRQMAEFYGCNYGEEQVIAARSNMSSSALLRRLLGSANIDTLILDSAYPSSQECYSAADIHQVSHCRTLQMLRLETLMERLIVECADFDDMLARFQAALSDIRKQGYCALKSIVAYRTGLEVTCWSKDAAASAFAEARVQVADTGTVRLLHKPLIDYLLHLALQEAAEQHVPLQFHTGYGDSDVDLRLGNPLLLRALCEKAEYGNVSIVLLHESYPYCQLGAYLASIYSHVYFDLSYAIPFVDLQEMLTFTRQALGIAPASKLMYSSDGIFVPEMHWASAMRARSIIGQVLQEMIWGSEIDQEQAYMLAWNVLHDTASTVYQL